MDRSAIVLANTFSNTLTKGKDTGILDLMGKPLIKHVIDAVSPVVDEVVVVANSPENVDRYVKIVGPHVKFAIAPAEGQSSLVGALAGFESAGQKYAFLVAYTVPFVSRDVVELLFELCPGKSATVPRWPNSQVEPLHAVYRRSSALEAAQLAVDEGKLDVHAIVEHMNGVRYVSTLVIEELDPELKTFFSVNTPLDLKRAEVLSKPRKTKRRDSCRY